MATAFTQPRWAELLAETLEKPGFLLEAYSRFRGFSLGNQVAALSQCHERKITPGPIATLKRWNELGRKILAGQKALWLCMPITVREKLADEASDTDKAERSARTVFVWKPRWFVLAQTVGPKPPPDLPMPAWDKERALASLGISEVEFRETDGNMQGYATGRAIAVSPIAEAPWKTLFHEIGHVLLGHQRPGAEGAELPRSVAEVEAESVALLCLDSLGLPGAANARGYIQHWNPKRKPLSEGSAARVFKTANAILRAGAAPPPLM